MNLFQFLRIKIDCMPISNKLPVNHTFKIPPDTQHCFGAKLFFSRLTGTESLFQGIRVVVIDAFCITCDNSPNKSFIHGITDKLTSDIHWTLRLFRCQFMRYRWTASEWFSKCLNLTMHGILLMQQVLPTAYKYFIEDFLPILCLYSQYTIM